MRTTLDLYSQAIDVAKLELNWRDAPFIGKVSDDQEAYPCAVTKAKRTVFLSDLFRTLIIHCLSAHFPRYRGPRNTEDFGKRFIAVFAGTRRRLH